MGAVKPPERPVFDPGLPGRRPACHHAVDAPTPRPSPPSDNLWRAERKFPFSPPFAYWLITRNYMLMCFNLRERRATWSLVSGVGRPPGPCHLTWAPTPPPTGPSPRPLPGPQLHHLCGTPAPPPPPVPVPSTATSPTTTTCPDFRSNHPQWG